MVDVHKLICQICNNVGVGDGSDGFFYCLRCGSQCEDVMDTAVDDDDIFNKSAVYLPSHQRKRPVAIKAEPISQYDSFYDSHSNFIRNLGLEGETPQQNDHVQVKREEEFDAAQFGEATPQHKYLKQGMKYDKKRTLVKKQTNLTMHQWVKDQSQTSFMCSLYGMRHRNCGTYFDGWVKLSLCGLTCAVGIVLRGIAEG